MSYYINFENISLNELKDILLRADLIKSRLIIKQDIHNNFQKLQDAEVDNAQELKDNLKTEDKRIAFSLKSGIDKEYLTILNREIKSFSPKPNQFEDFPELPDELLEKLKCSGIFNTKQFYEMLFKERRNEKFYKLKDFSPEEILYLEVLSDLSRIRWVNHTFASMLNEAGYPSVDAVANADFHDLAEEINQINSEKNYYKGKIGIHDFKLTVDAAKMISSLI